MSNTVSAPNIVVETPTEIQPTMSGPNDKILLEGPKKRKARKNHTDAKINPARYESIHEWLEEFFYQASQQKPTRGSEQSWNSNGFIDHGAALRLPNRGAANMICLLIDIMADRIVNSSNHQVSQDAEAFYNICLEFMQKRIAERKEEYAREILRAAAVIQSQKI